MKILDIFLQNNANSGRNLFQEITVERRDLQAQIWWNKYANLLFGVNKKIFFGLPRAK